VAYRFTYCVDQHVGAEQLADSQGLTKYRCLHSPCRVDLGEHLSILSVETLAVCTELAGAIVAGPVELYVADLVE
jgi:hypothetical protein